MAIKLPNPRVKIYAFLLVLAFPIFSYSQTTIASYDFESGSQGWDVSAAYGYHNTSGSNTCSGIGKLYVRDDETTSIVTSPVFDLSSYSSVTFSFCSRGYGGLENGDGYDLEYFDGTTWSTLRAFRKGTDWTNDSVNSSFSVTVSTGLNSNSRFRFEGESNEIDEYSMFDDVLIEGTPIVSGPEINVTDNDGTNISDGDSSPSVAESTDFENVYYNSGTNSNNFIIENNGTTDLTITSVTSNNATEFAVTGTTSGLITPGNSITFTITFDPTAIGTRTGEIVIISDDSNEGTYNFDVEGEGVDYCVSNGNESYQTGVSRVLFNAIDNNDTTNNDNGGYEDFTAQSTSILQNNSYGLTVNVDTDGGYRVDVLVWIDWNQNGVFSDPGEEYDLGQTTTDGAMPGSPISITVPGTASLGSTRMRVSAKYNGNSGSCETGFDGEVEDYTVNIMPDCTNPAQPSVIAGNTTLCVGNSETYTVTNIPGLTYDWVLPSGWSITSGSGTNSIIVTVGSGSGNIEVNAVDGSCNSTARTLAVISSDVPAQPSAISGTTTPCLGASITYSVTNVVGVSYAWTLPPGLTGTSTSNSITVTVSGAVSGDIIVTPSNSCGNGTSRLLTLASSDVPAQPSIITGNTPVCEGTSQTYSVANVPGLTYNWTLPSGWTQTGGGTTNSITVTVGSGSGNVQVTPTNSCGTGTLRTLAVTTLTAPTQPSIITGNTPVCEGTSQTYSVANVPGLTYNWTLPSGWTQTGGGTTNSITVTVGSGSGNIAVIPTNGVCDGAVRTLAVISTTVPPQPSTITGSSTVCDGNTETYSVANVVGTSYNWTVPAGWTIDGGNGTNSITVTAVGVGSGTIEVTPSTVCGVGTSRTLSVSSSIILQPSIITGNTPVCEGTSQTYSVTNVPGLTYNWTLPFGWTQTGGGTTNSITVTVGTGSGNIEVTPSSSCGSGTPRLLPVVANEIPTITATTPGSRNGPGTVVLNAETSVTGSTVSLYANAVGGTALNSAIDLGPGLGADLTTPGIITTTTFYLEANNGSCISTPRIPIVATVHYSEITVLGNGNIIIDEDATPVTGDFTNLGSTPVAVGLTRSYTIQNTGTIDLTIGTLNITGVDASEFVVTLAPAATVAPAATTTFEITFTPTSLAVKNANLSFVTNDPDENPFSFDIRGIGSTGLYPEINLQGNGNNIVDGASGTDTNNHTDFGPVTLPGSITRTFTIHNTGTGPLLLTGTPMVEIIGGGGVFTVTAQPTGSSVPASGNLTFQVTFNPTLTGSYDAIILINNDDANESVYDFAIRGSAVVSGVEIDIQGNHNSIVNGDTTPSALDQTNFGITDISTAIPLTYNIHSLGTNNLTLSSTVSITGAAEFTSSSIASTNVAPGNNTTFVITFTPTSLGVKNATVTISSNDSDEGTYTFDITANVQSLPAQTVAPGGVTSSLKFWLKADSNIGVVSNNAQVDTWVEQTLGSTKNAVSRVLKEPIFQNNISNNINFNPVVHFDGNDYMSGGQGFNNADMFIVVKPTNNVYYTTNAMDIYGGDDITTGFQDVTGIEMGDSSIRNTNELLAYNQGSSSSYGIGEINTTKFYSKVNIFNPRINSGSSRMDILNNGNNVSTSTVNTGSYRDIVNSRYWLGRSEQWDASYDGDILEVINYNVRNNATDRRKIETYLAIKYGITLGVNGTSVDYYDSDATTIYNANALFNYNIAGIGRDDASELNQKQSKTENTDLDITIGLTDIYDINSNNPNTFANDKEYLVWGHNNNTLAAQAPIAVNLSSGAEITPSLLTDVDFVAIGRIWRVIENGGDIPMCKISIPESILTATITPPGDFLMFIAPNPVFNPTAEYRVMRSDGNGNLVTDYDFDGTKYITFGYAPEKTFSRSIQFDGVQDYLDAGDVLDLNPTEFTVSAWVKRSNTNASIISKRDNGYSSGYDFKINNSGYFEASWNGGSQVITSSVIIPANQWHQVAVVYNGTVAKLYIDGVEDSTQTTALAAPTSNTESFIIAAADGSNGNTTSFFNGNIDEIRIWDKALTEDELHFVMNQEVHDNFSNTTLYGSYFLSNSITPTKNDIVGVPWSNLQGYYPMSTYTYTNLKDASGNGNRAALKNLNSVDHQTAPLPYVSRTNTNWDTPTTWNANSFQTIPGATSLIDPSVTVDWNIVQISSNVIMNNTALPAANNGNRNVLGLLVDNSRELTAQGTTNMTNGNDGGNGLTVTHYLGLNGKIDLEGGSQLIQTLDSDLVTTATGELERDQQGTESSYNYNYWSSSVGAKTSGTANSNYTIANVMKDGRTGTPANITFNTNYAAADGTIIPTPMIISTYWLRTFNSLNNTYSEWSDPLNPNTSQLAPGEGFTMKGVNGNAAFTDFNNLTFVGRPNNGNITLQVDSGNDRLIGNPYPSAIDAREFILDNISDGAGRAASNIFNGALYFWHHFSGKTHILKQYVGGYATYTLMGEAEAISNDSRINANNNVGGKEPERFIPVNQAFFVNTTIDASISGTVSPITGGLVTFKNSQRIFQSESAVSGNNGSVFFKPSKKGKNNKQQTVVDNRQKIKLLFDSPKGYYRKILVGVDEETSNNYDIGYDAQMADVGIEDMYWTLNDAKLVIQALPDFNTNREIPFGIKIDEPGDVKISIDELLNIDENQLVGVKDLQTGEVFDLRNESFEISLEKGTYNQRFSIVFKPQYYPLTEVDLFDGIFINMNNDESILKVQRIVDTEIKNIQLFNYMGQSMVNWSSNLNASTISKPINNLATGVYIVKVTTKDGIVNKKIIIE